jgi:L-ascorbate metabolism protein UlaG (beta-lactamase superfamily)
MASAVKSLTLPASSDADFRTGSVLFVGNATVLIRYAGFCLLTDPNFLRRGERAHLGYGLRSERLTDPAFELERLPRLDLCLLSHLHEDHFDRRVALQLDRDLPIVTTVQAAATLAGRGFARVVPLAPWESLQVDKGGARLRITAMPARHGPRLVSRLLPAVNGSLLEFVENQSRQTRYRLYISGDTVAVDELRPIASRFPDIDLALLHLGGARLRGLLVSMDAEQGVRLLRLLAPRRAIPIHYNDYAIFKSPLSDFERRAKEAGLRDAVTFLAHGETYVFAGRQPRARAEPQPQSPG